MNLARLERFLVVLAVVSSPAWFLTIGGVNLTPMDLLLLTVGVLVVLRRGELVLFPSAGVGLAVLLFLTGLTLSLLGTPAPKEGVLSFFQYLLALLVLVPVAMYGLRASRTRWYAVLGLATVLNGLVLSTVYATTVAGATNVSLWFGNTNQLYWLLAVAFIFDSFLALESDLNWGLRVSAIVLGVLAMGTVLTGRSMSAILMVGIGAWTAVLYVIDDRFVSRRPLYVYVGATAIAGAALGAFLVTHLEFVKTTLEVSIDPRAIQVSAGIRQGLANPFTGTGLESAEIVFQRLGLPTGKPIHSTFISHFMESGLFALIGYVGVMGYWLRDVFFASISTPGWSMFERIPIAVFGTVIPALALFQPAPLRRIWWLFFAMGYVTVLGRRNDSRPGGQPDPASLEHEH